MGFKRAKFVQPDLILLDIMMPGIDGFETCRNLKADETTQDIPVIFMTALSEIEDKVKGFAVGGVDYITKPIRKEELFARVKTHVSLQQIRKTLQQKNIQLEQHLVECKHAEEQIERLNQLKEDLLGPHNFDEKLEYITDGVVTIFNADFARIWITKPGDLCESGCFHAKITEGPHICRYRDLCLYLVASSGRYTHLDGEVHRRVPFGCYKIGRIAAGDDAKFITNDVVHDPRVHNHNWARKLGLVSFAGYRLLSAAGKPIGVLALFSKHVISPDDDRLLEGLATTTAQVIQTATAEEALRKSEALHHALVENFPQNIFCKDVEGKFTFVNQQFCRTEGKSLEAILGKTDFDLYPPKLAQKYWKDDQHVLETGEILDMVEAHQTPEGEILYVQVIKTPIYDANDQIVGVQGIFWDITERKQAEHVLKESEQRYRALFERTNDAVFLLNMEGVHLAVNQRAADMLGYTQDEIIGMSAKQVVAPYEYPDTQNKLNALIAGDLLPIYERIFRRKDGTDIPVEINVAMVYDSAGKPSHIQSIVRDISERKRTEETLRRAKEEALEAKEASEAARRASEAANRAKSTFLANMSHELRTPLNAILGFAQLVARSQNLDTQQQENLNAISHSGEHLLSLIYQVLDLSKVEAGRIPLNETECDLYDLLDGLEDMFRLRTEEKGLRLLFERADKVPQYIHTDALKLRQVLINLLNNAIKFTEHGSVTLYVTTGGIEVLEYGSIGEASPQTNTPTLQHSNTPTLHFELSDTGPGIVPEEMGTLFEAFTQTHAGRQVQEGTGLGLAICHKFAQLMGGDIHVNSHVGKGTTFTFEVPVGIVEQPAVERHQGPVNNRVIALKPGQVSYRLLIVDDDANNRKLLIQILKHVGFEVQEVTNGQEAIDYWKTWAPHLIWMNMRMPIMDGYEATREIRRLETENQKLKTTERPSQIKIIAVTASSFEEERKAILSVGCNDVLRKPFQETEVFDLLHQHLGVQFVYEDGGLSREEEQPIGREALAPEILRKLPETLRHDLQYAVDTIDFDEVVTIIGQIRPQHPALAEQLTKLVKEYRFDVLQQLLAEE
jgi:PAS domain S-box-containing protein